MAVRTPEEMREAFEKFATHMAEQSKRADASWQSIADAVESSSKHLTTGWSGVLTQFTGSAPVIQRIASTLSSGFRGSREAIDGMIQKFDEIRNRLGETMNRASGARQTAEWNRLHRQAKLMAAEIAAHTKLQETVARTMNGTTGAAIIALVGSTKLALDYSRQVNEALRQGNPDYVTRAKIVKEISQVQAATGNEMSDMVKAAAVLTDYGYDLSSTFKDTLSTVVKMEEGLGVSYESSAQLAVITRRIDGDFKSVANSVARVKTDTALAAEEAVKFATQIGKAVMMLKPGSGSLVDQTSEYINRLAGALKELTGSGQDILAMLSSFTTEAGMMGASTLGATPDFLSSPAKTKEVTENFVKYVNRQLSGTSGFQRMATIQLLAEQFNTTADMIVNADKMLAKYNATQKSATSLNEQWREQTSEIGKTFSKIFESLRSIIQQSLLPAFQYLRPALSFAADAASYLAQRSWIVYTASGALAVSAIAATVAIGRLSVAMVHAALASKALQASLGTSGGGGGIGSIFTRSGASSLAGWLRKDLITGKALPAGKSSALTRVLSGAVTTWLPRIGGYLSVAGKVLSRIAGPLTIAFTTGALAGLAMEKLMRSHGYKLDEIVRNSKPDAYHAAMDSMGRGSVTRDALLKQVSMMAASGAEASAIQDYLAKNIIKLKGLYSVEGGRTDTAEWREKMVQAIVQDAGAEINRQRVKMGYTTLTEQTQGDRDRDQQMIELFKSVAANTELMTKLQKSIEHKAEKLGEIRRQTRDEFETEERLKQNAWRRVGEAHAGAIF